MKKKILLSMVFILCTMFAFHAPLKASMVLGPEITVREIVEKYLGCNGGDDKCYTGSLSAWGDRDFRYLVSALIT